MTADITTSLIKIVYTYKIDFKKQGHNIIIIVSIKI